MEKQFLTDYLISKNKKLKKGSINLIRSYAGSGKSYFITGKKGLINNTQQFYNEGMYKYLNFSQQKQRILIVTDNIMNRDVLTNIDGYQNFNYKDFYKARSIHGIDELLNGENGVVNVITYSKLINLLTYKNTEKVIIECIDLIVMDEIHNLFDFSLKYDKDENEKGYFTIIDNLNDLSEKTLIVGLTATPQKIKKYLNNYTLDAKINEILNDYDLENIISYTEYENRVYFSINNVITDLCNNKTNDKVLIYTKKIATCKIYKQKLTNAGYKVEYLCADNKLNDKQQILKQYLINKETLPKDLDILIINEAYQTGWNLKDDSVQIIIIDDNDETTMTQARNRVRHNIKLLITKLKDVQIDVFKTYDFNNQMNFIIDEEYLNVELSTEEFNFIKGQYGTIRPIMNDEGDIHAYCSKYDFINKDLASNGYIYNNKMIIKADEKDKLYKELEDYLQSCIGKKLFKEEQQELIEVFNIRDNRNRLQKSPKLLNVYLEENKLPYIIINKQIRIDNKRKTIWIVNNNKK